ncbi:MAG: SGNH/GDSL hydrolase family protein, partial [Candidatus Aminicenantes bacterium]|nr:SGNH/GDSL hydrolase family protein [Candidatus Aminicenantes bacterium]
ANLSAGMRGENILLGVRCAGENFYVFWLNYHQKRLRLAYYDQHSSRPMPLNGFASFGLPEIIVENGRLRALLFLADRSGNNDIFYYDLEERALTQLTETPYSEKRFSWSEESGTLQIEARSLKGTCAYRFDSHLKQNTLIEEKAFRRRLKKENAAPAPNYYNTFIGFGDSITWGQISGVQLLDLCYLTQMRDVFLPSIYGSSEFINLGVPGDGTYEAAQRVDQGLNNYSAFYFLMMIGVNNVRSQAEFSLASSLEDIEYIIDAALARNMRVIVSTLTPRKDYYASLDWYWDHLHSLNAGILDLAAKKGTASIDTFNTFMNLDPPDGWKDLIETPGLIIVDGEEVVVKGNHPNAAGHYLIASLFAPVLAAFPPLAPGNVSVLNPESGANRKVFWDANYESDFSYFEIEFGFTPNALDYTLTTAVSYHMFTLFPFLPQLYFRLRTVDRGERHSDFVTLETAAVSSTTRPIQKK